MRTNYVYLVQNLHTNQWQLLVEFSLYVDQNGTGTVMQVEYPAMTVLPFVVAKMEKLNRNMNLMLQSTKRKQSTYQLI